ncbi:hypothetical protein AY599_28540 [Leptolyngbya valderiana BDU 20041]|nr:hypothetical protein AY599_28540 [Leptolyngbya valderiana BDU 20041]
MNFGAAAAVVLMLAGSSARAQEVLLIQPDTFEFGVIGGALDELNLEYTFAVSRDQILDALRSQSWDLIIVRGRSVGVIETLVLDELEPHVASGGLLHVQLSDLENASARQYRLLGLRDAIDLELPLSELGAPSPAHPSVPGIGFLSLWDQTYPPDYGDALVPSEDSYFTQWYADTRLPATVISMNGNVLVNGPQWDNWAPGDTSAFVARQIAWMLSCKADLDGDGELTVFDFLEFQTLFDAGDVRADVLYDGRHDIFDFLAFFNLFESGC